MLVGENVSSRVAEEIYWYSRIRPSKLMEIYVALVSIVNIFVSIIVLYILTQPLAFYDNFTLSGFISPLRYSIFVGGVSVKYPVLESMSIVSRLVLVFNILTLVLSILTYYSTRVKFRTWIGLLPVASGLNALILSLLYSILRVFVQDILAVIPHTVRLDNYVADFKIPPPEIQYTWTYYLTRYSLVFLILNTILLFFTTSILLYLLINPKPPVLLKTRKKLSIFRKLAKFRKKFLPIVLFTVLLTAFHIYSYVYSYRYLSSGVEIKKPTVWFEDPGVPGVYVELYSDKTRALVEVDYFETRLALINRSGFSFDLRVESVVYENFVPYAETGCNYYVGPDGVEIIVTGNPAGGLYRGCGLRYRDTVKARDYSVVFVMKTSDTTPVDGIRGVIFMETATGYYYVAGVKNNATGWFFGIYEYRGRTIREPGGPVLPVIVDRAIPSVRDRWVSVSFSLTYLDGAVYMRAWIFDYTTGSLISYVEKTVINPIRVDSFGIGVYQIRGRPSAVFQMIGFTTEYRVVIIRGLKHCCYVYIYDSSGNLVGETHVPEDNVAVITLRNSAVVDGTIRAVCNDKEYVFDADVILGGDVYELRLVFRGVVLEIHTSTNLEFNGFLSLSNVSCIGDIHCVEIALANLTKVSYLNITIVGYNGEAVVLQPYTEELLFKRREHTLVGYIIVEIETYLQSYCEINLQFNFQYGKGIYGSLVATLRFST